MTKQNRIGERNLVMYMTTDVREYVPYCRSSVASPTPTLGTQAWKIEQFQKTSSNLSIYQQDGQGYFGTLGEYKNF